VKPVGQVGRLAFCRKEAKDQRSKELGMGGGVGAVAGSEDLELKIAAFLLLRAEYRARRENKR
jgi:hypothetical protein